MTCKARQCNEQMLCECGLAWDVNDPEPPGCRKLYQPSRQQGKTEAMKKIRKLLNG
jgi:hypothetical protein